MFSHFFIQTTYTCITKLLGWPLLKGGLCDKGNQHFYINLNSGKVNLQKAKLKVQLGILLYVKSHIYMLWNQIISMAWELL